MEKVSKACQAQVSKGRGHRSTVSLEQGEQAQCDPGFSFFPAGPKLNTWLGLCKPGRHVGMGFQPEGLMGWGLGFIVM